MTQKSKLSRLNQMPSDSVGPNKNKKWREKTQRNLASQKRKKSSHLTIQNAKGQSDITLKTQTQRQPIGNQNRKWRNNDVTKLWRQRGKCRHVVRRGNNERAAVQRTGTLLPSVMPLGLRRIILFCWIYCHLLSQNSTSLSLKILASIESVPF